MNLIKKTTQDLFYCCFQLKLGFIAQSCIAHGFSTLLANIFAMRSQVSERFLC